MSTRHTRLDDGGGVVPSPNTLSIKTAVASESRWPRFVMIGLGLVFFIVAAVVGLLSAYPATQDYGPDEIRWLPGHATNKFGFRQHAGFITVDETNKRNLFFWFVESARDPAKDPLIMWKNGGPGCSSLLGIMEENGPFYPNADGNLVENTMSWNRIANVLYLESPAGVGFSYSETPGDYYTTDERTSSDTVVFLRKFFERYPQFKNHSLYLAGESYTGHYLVEDVYQILQNNADASKPHINLHGLMNGNPFTDTDIDDLAFYTVFTEFGLLSNSTLTDVIDLCYPTGEKEQTPACQAQYLKAVQEMGPINIYELFEDICVDSPQTVRLLKMAAQARPHSLQAAMARELQARRQRRKTRGSGYDGINDGDPIPPCISEHTIPYLNRPDVQAALHISRRTSNLPVQWLECTEDDVLHYSRESYLRSMLPTYKAIFEMAPQLRILIFSGDVDGVVPFSGTREWVRRLDMQELSPMRPWTVNRQVAGRVTVYDRMTVATVRNAGHMAPASQPVRTRALIERFLTKTDI